jgi:hypothetical protein
MKPLKSKSWLWLVAGLVPPVTGMLLLLLVGPSGDYRTMTLFLSVNAIGSVCFGIGVAKHSKSNEFARTAMGILAGIILFIINVVLLFL